MFEHHSEPLLSRTLFMRRLARYWTFGLAVVVGSLALGVAGYHWLEGLSWIDALLNAAMILGGMGPVNVMSTAAGKLFASFYALFSGVVFLVAAGILIAPLVHRFLHHFHLEAEADPLDL